MKGHLIFASLVLAIIGDAAMAQQQEILRLSRNATVRVTSSTGNSSGSGFFISEQHVLTCFHVIARLETKPLPNNQTNVNWSIFQDIKITTLAGEEIAADVVSVPTQNNTAPLLHDFAVLKLRRKTANKIDKIELAPNDENVVVGAEIVFSGHPLATPGMVTHRGMISGFNGDRSLIFVQASINKGNSGGGLFDEKGRVIGIVSMREGGISRGLQQLTTYIDQTAAHGSVQLMGVDPLQSMKAIIDTMDTHISTGIGYAHSIKFAREYITQNPLK